jgi:hypothetical protein
MTAATEADMLVGMTTSPAPQSSPPAAPVLEPAALAFAEATANPPCLFDPPVSEGRKTRPSGPRSPPRRVPVTSVRYDGTIHDFVMLNALRRDENGVHSDGEHTHG